MRTSHLSTGDLTSRKVKEFSAVALLRGSKPSSDKLCAVCTDGAAAVEGLRAELARAKEQARRSDAAASRAAEELKAERAAHCLNREEVAELAMKVKDAADRNEALEKERLSEREDLKKATAEAKDARSAMRAMKEELRQAGDIVAGKPFLLRRRFMDQKYAQFERLWSPEDPYMDLAASAADVRRITRRKSYIGLNSIVRIAHFR